MNTTTIQQVKSKLKQLPEVLLEDVDRYIDFLTFKYKQDSENIPEWHKDVVMKRIKEAQKPVDAFEMLDSLDKD